MAQSTISDPAVETKVDSRAAAIRVTLAGGILGFENHRSWLLIAHPEEYPFQWLRAQDDPQLAFLVLPPYLVEPDYKPDVSAGDVALLKLRDLQDALVLNIVTLRDDRHATLNLKGPILLNRRALIGKQVVPVNAADYSVQHPLPIAG
jgi:flagellar assembly factor FliW